MKMSNGITIRFDEELKQWLKAEAERLGVSIADVVRMSVKTVKGKNKITK